MDLEGRPRKLRHKSWFDPDAEIFEDDRDSYAPLVWQCRYSGIEVPEALWRYVEFGFREPYSDNQAEDISAPTFEEFDRWCDAFAEHVGAKGKVPPGRYRAYGYSPPRHRLADLKLAWRDRRMRLGHPPSDSSPAAQQELDLNDDVTLRPKPGE